MYDSLMHFLVQIEFVLSFPLAWARALNNWILKHLLDGSFAEQFNQNIVTHFSLKHGRCLISCIICSCIMKIMLIQNVSRNRGGNLRYWTAFSGVKVVRGLHLCTMEAAAVTGFWSVPGINGLVSMHSTPQLDVVALWPFIDEGFKFQNV